MEIQRIIEMADAALTIAIMSVHLAVVAMVATIAFIWSVCVMSCVSRTAKNKNMDHREVWNQ